MKEQRHELAQNLIKSSAPHLVTPAKMRGCASATSSLLDRGEEQQLRARLRSQTSSNSHQNYPPVAMGGCLTIHTSHKQVSDQIFCAPLVTPCVYVYHYFMLHGRGEEQQLEAPSRGSLIIKIKTSHKPWKRTNLHRSTNPTIRGVQQACVSCALCFR